MAPWARQDGGFPQRFGMGTSTTAAGRGSLLTVLAPPMVPIWLADYGSRQVVSRLHRSAPLAKQLWGAATLGGSDTELKRLRVPAAPATGGASKGASIGFSFLVGNPVLGLVFSQLRTADIPDNGDMKRKLGRRMEGDSIQPFRRVVLSISLHPTP